MTDIKSTLDAVGGAADTLARNTYSRGFADGYREAQETIDNGPIRGVVEDIADMVAAKNAAERRESELGLQVVAQAARLRLADGLYQCLLGCHRCGCQHPACSWCRDDGDIRDALAAWDAVPGDQGGEG